MRALSAALTVVFLGACIDRQDGISGFGAPRAGSAEPAEHLRPVWVWGVPNWAGDYDLESLATANQWAMERFGVTFKITGGVPQDMDRDAALDLVIAEGEFPDLIRSISFTKMTQLAEDGSLLVLDKYARDPENYPVYAEADPSSLLQFRVNGILYGLPGYGWRIRKDDPAWVWPMWIMRHDVYLKYGYPQTSPELLDTMRKVKTDGTKDLEGRPVVPLGLNGGHSPAMLRQTLWQFKGAGFEVDAQQRLMPVWASKQAHDAISFFNLMWREGLLSPGLFAQDNEHFQDDLKFARYAFDCGATWNVAVLRSQVASIFHRNGPDHPDTKAAVAAQHIMLVNPVKENPGRIGNGGYGGPPSPTVVSAECPNPDGAIGYLHWLLTDEGLISVMLQAGYKDVHWEFTDKPLYWQMKPDYRNGAHEQVTQGIAHSWESAENAKNPDKTPLFPPVVHYLSSPSYSSYNQRLLYRTIKYQYGREGVLPLHAGEYPGEPTVLEWGLPFSIACKEIVQPLPSYFQVNTPTPPEEQLAESTALEVFDERIKELITARSLEVFETKYKAFIDRMITIANWKPIYKAKQQRWLQWLESNHIDDRRELKTVDPIPQWKQVMGWS